MSNWYARKQKNGKIRIGRKKSNSRWKVQYQKNGKIKVSRR
jgi:hypothetical protein